MHNDAPSITNWSWSLLAAKYTGFLNFFKKKAYFITKTFNIKQQFDQPSTSTTKILFNLFFDSSKWIVNRNEKQIKKEANQAVDCLQFFL